MYAIRSYYDVSILIINYNHTVSVSSGCPYPSRAQFPLVLRRGHLPRRVAHTPPRRAYRGRRGIYRPAEAGGKRLENIRIRGNRRGASGSRRDRAVGWHGRPVRRAGRRGRGNVPGERGATATVNPLSGRYVITSYSIHYTKLYETARIVT